MEIKISKADVIWNYVAQFFMLGTSFIMLPLLLTFLSANELGLYYIFLSIDSIIVLIDMGFSSQFSRNITYVLSGAQKLEKEGISNVFNERINEKLLACTLQTARKIYKIFATIALILLLFFGTIYIKVITREQNINNLLLIWILVCFSNYFNLYFFYLNAFLSGRGMIKETKSSQVMSRIFHMVLCSTMLYFGYGLLSVAISNFVSPFVYRLLAYRSFYDDFFKSLNERYCVSWSEVKETFVVLFYNAKKLGVISLLGTVIGHASTLIIGAFLPLFVVGSYGIMVQMGGIIAACSTGLFLSLIPEFSGLVVKQQWETLRKKFGLCLFLFYIVQILGFIVITLAPLFFDYFSFNTKLPSYTIIILYVIYKFFEQNQSLYSQLLMVNNDLRFYPSAIWTGVTSIGLLILLLFMGWGLLGVIISQSLPLYIYAAWKWPFYVSKKYGIRQREHVFKYSCCFIRDTINSIRFKY